MWELANLQQVKAERLDLSDNAMEPSPVQQAGQDRFRPLPPP